MVTQSHTHAHPRTSTLTQPSIYPSIHKWKNTKCDGKNEISFELNVCALLSFRLFLSLWVLFFQILPFLFESEEGSILFLQNQKFIFKCGKNDSHTQNKKRKWKQNEMVQKEKKSQNKPSLWKWRVEKNAAPRNTNTDTHTVLVLKWILFQMFLRQCKKIYVRKYGFLIQ